MDLENRKYYSLSDFIEEYSDKNIENKYRPVAVGRYGIRSRESIYSKELAKDYSKNKLIYKNTLTVGMGSVQIDIGILTDDTVFSVSPAYHTFKISGIDSKYLDYCLQTRNLDMFERYVKKSARQGKTIDFKSWLTYKIPVYDIDTQKEIVLRIETIKNIIARLEQELDLMDELIKSRFVEMFDEFEKVELCSIANIVMGQSPNSESYNDKGEGMPFFQGKADYGDKYTAVAHWTTEPNKVVPNGSVLMSVRAPVGPVNIANVECCLGRGLCGINAIKGKTNNEFLYNSLKTMEEDIASKGSGSTFKAITKKDVFELQIPKAPIDLQNEFSVFSQQVDKSKFVCHSRYFLCDTFTFASLTMA